VPSTELNTARQRLLISNTIRRADGVQLRVIAETAPDPAARLVTPTLEDAYLGVIAGEGAGGAQSKGAT